MDAAARRKLTIAGAAGLGLAAAVVIILILMPAGKPPERPGGAVPELPRGVPSTAPEAGPQPGPPGPGGVGDGPGLEGPIPEIDPRRPETFPGAEPPPEPTTPAEIFEADLAARITAARERGMDPDREAAAILALLEDPEKRAAALALLREDPREIALELIARAFAVRGDPEAFALAREILISDAGIDYRPRALAAIRIAAASPDGHAVLLDAAQRAADGHPLVAAAAIGALGPPASASADAAARAPGALRAWASGATDARVRAAAIDRLPAWSRERADRELIAHAVRNDRAAAVRAAAVVHAARAAGEGDRAATEALIALLADRGEEPSVRAAAIAALSAERDLPPDLRRALDSAPGR